MKRRGLLAVALLLVVVGCTRDSANTGQRAAAPPIPLPSPPREPAPTPNVSPGGRQAPLVQKRRGRTFARTACKAAYNACVADCGGSVFDYDESEYLNNTDFAESCEDACGTGGAACDDADRDERCDEFASACEGECDSTVFDYDSGEYRYNTDADSQCEDTCSSGQGACD